MMTTSNNLPSEPEDIFADTDASSNAGPGDLRPIPPVSFPETQNISPEEAIETPIDSYPVDAYSAQTLGPTTTSLSDFSEQSTSVPTARFRRFSIRRIIIIIIAIAVLLLIAGIVWGGYYWYTHRDEVIVEPNTPIQVENINITPVNVNTTLTNTNTIPVNTSTTQYTDSDHDGLSDDEETEVNTNPLKKDTDEDGLSDREEVRVYLTDPRKSDTDEDGYIDGDEVANFYHPNHPDPKKRLFDIPKQ